MTNVINLKVDEYTKIQAQKIASEMGLSLSAILKVFLKEFIRTKKLNVDLDKIPPVIQKKWIAEEKKAIKSSKRYDDVNCLVSDCLK